MTLEVIMTTIISFGNWGVHVCARVCVCVWWGGGGGGGTFEKYYYTCYMCSTTIAVIGET